MARILDLNGFSRRSLLRVGQRIKIPDGPRMASNTSAQKKTASSRNIASNLKTPSKSSKATTSTPAKSPTPAETSADKSSSAEESSSAAAGERSSAADNSQELAGHARSSSQQESAAGTNQQNLAADTGHEGAEAAAGLAKAQAYIEGHDRVKKAARAASRKSVGLPSRAPARVAFESTGKKVHVVRRGENLSTIARKYRTSVRDIAQANALGKRSKIFVGASLVIPD
jgi:LysM repeat protein